MMRRRRGGRVVVVVGALSAAAVAAPVAAEPIGVATTVEGPDDNGGITIKVPIDCAGCKGKKGPDGTPLADYWKRIAETWWNDAFSFFSYKPCFTFKLEIDITSKGANFRGDEDRHVVQVGAAGSTDVPSGFEGTKERNPSKGGRDGTRSFDEHRDGIWTEDISEATIAHEVGHLFGLGDDYEVVSQNPRVTRPKPGREGTLMGDNGAIDPALIDRIGKQVEKLLGGLPCATWEGPLRSTGTSSAGGATCALEESGTVTLGVGDNDKVTGTLELSGSYTCTDAGTGITVTVPSGLRYPLSGTLDDGTFRLKPAGPDRSGVHSPGACVISPILEIPVERGTGSGEQTQSGPSVHNTCTITVERQPDDEPVG